MMSSADASVAYATPASPKIIAVRTPNFFTLPPSERFEKLAKLVVQQCVAGKGFHRPKALTAGAVVLVSPPGPYATGSVGSLKESNVNCMIRTLEAPDQH
jgi:hypothetical protein